MSLNDLFGLAVIALIILCGIYGLYRITKPVDYSQAAYERRLKKGSGIARGTMNAMMYAMQELLHPKAVQAIHVERDLKAGYYDVQQETGDDLGERDLDPVSEPKLSHRTESRTRVGIFRRLLNVFRLRR
jgi:hypothetical protein